MFIHIGNENVIQSKDIVSIIDYSIVSASTIMTEMMSLSMDKVIGPVEEAKSLVITKDQLYASTLSVVTLKKRASMTSTISKLDDYSSDLELE